jgi:gluconolactonase
VTELLGVDAELEKVWTGAGWAEGPVWLPDRGVLRFSDIPNNRILENSPASHEVSVHNPAAGYVNGRTTDLLGRVVQCSNQERRIERDHDGVVSVVVDRFEGRRFNSPNDIVVAGDGSIWFTDPPYGLGRGNDGVKEYEGCFVFRYDESTGELRAVITDMVHPNGLAFSPDVSLLYVADTGSDRDADTPDMIRVYDVADGACTDGRDLVDPGHADGFRVDREGRIWTSTLDALAVLSPHGDELLRIGIGEMATNVAFGGDGGDLYLTSATSLYRIRTATGPAVRPART